MIRNALLSTLLLASSVLAQTHHALHFDGINDRVNCGNAPAVDISGTTITLEAWIYPTAWRAGASEGSIINKEGGNSGYALRCGNNGRLSFAFGNGNTTPPWMEIASAQSALTLNTWQHVAATFDGITLKFYRDGVQLTPSTTTLTSDMTIGSTALELTIGNWSQDDTRGFIGKIDEVRIWNIVLDAATIADHMQTSFCDPEPGLVAYYKFDQGVAGGNNTSITTLNDETGTNTGTLVNLALTGSTSNFVDGAILGTQISETLCPDEIYMFNGQELADPGVYTAAFPVAGTCDSIVVLTLTEIPVNVNVAQNGHLLMAMANGAQYQWMNCVTDQPISGATMQYYTASANGQYAVIITQNSCSDTSVCYNVTTIGIEEIERPTMRVWPQPATDRLSVELSAPLSNADLRIADLTGRVVYRRIMPSVQRTTVEVSDLVAGVYFLEVRAGDVGTTVRFVKE